MRSRYSWPYAHPPNVDFDINEHSPQAEGLVFWLPLLGPRYGPFLDRAQGRVLTPVNSPLWTPDGWIGNSLLFDNAAEEYLYIDSTPITGPPFTMTCWGKSNDDTAPQGLVWIGDKDAPTDYWSIMMEGHVSGNVGFYANESTAQIARSTTTFTQDQWHHVCGIEYASNSRAVLLDGAGKGTNSTERTPDAADRVGIGAWCDSTVNAWMSGSIMDVRIYNVAKADHEALEMVNDPWDLVRPRVRLWQVKLPDALGNPWYSYAQQQ